MKRQNSKENVKSWDSISNTNSPKLRSNRTESMNLRRKFITWQRRNPKLKSSFLDLNLNMGITCIRVTRIRKNSNKPCNSLKRKSRRILSKEIQLLGWGMNSMRQDNHHTAALSVNQYLMKRVNQRYCWRNSIQWLFINWRRELKN